MRSQTYPRDRVFWEENELDRSAVPRWTEQSRQQQQERIQQQRPWLQATGPITSYGKRVASRNAVKNKRTLSQQLHFGAARCENAAEVAHPNSDSDRSLEVGESREVHRGLRTNDARLWRFPA